MSKKYIDADKLKKHFDWWNNEEKQTFNDIIDAQPAADVEEVRRGEWNEDDYGFNTCSKCGYELETAEATPPYCPNCGAKMKCKKKKTNFENVKKEISSLDIKAIASAIEKGNGTSTDRCFSCPAKPICENLTRVELARTDCAAQIEKWLNLEVAE